MTWPQDPSATAKHTCHHDNGEPLSEKDQHLVSAAELELEDGDPIAVEVFTDHPVDGGVPRSETLKIEILKGDEARASHKTVQTRLDKAEALQIDRSEGVNDDYYEEWKDDLRGKREDDKRDYTPKHHPHHREHHAGKAQHA